MVLVRINHTRDSQVRSGVRSEVADMLWSTPLSLRCSLSSQVEAAAGPAAASMTLLLLLWLRGWACVFSNMTKGFGFCGTPAFQGQRQQEDFSPFSRPPAHARGFHLVPALPHLVVIFPPQCLMSCALPPPASDSDLQNTDTPPPREGKYLSRKWRTRPSVHLSSISSPKQGMISWLVVFLPKLEAPQPAQSPVNGWCHCPSLFSGGDRREWVSRATLGSETPVLQKPSIGICQGWKPGAFLPSAPVSCFPCLDARQGPMLGAGWKPSYVWQEGVVSSSQEQTSSGNLAFCCWVPDILNCVLRTVLLFR